jgi:hypothetical protein
MIGYHCHTRNARPLRRPVHGRYVFALIVCLTLAIGCNSLKRMGATVADRPERDPALVLPGKSSARVSQFVFYYDFEMKKEVPLFQELGDLRDEVYKELKLPSANTLIQVYLFENRDQYERYMIAKYPDLPRRRAFFVAQPRAVSNTEDLLVYTFWGDRVQQDLRHEVTHALLHSVLKDVPLWLDEGLAEYYEMPPDKQTTIQAHLEQIRRDAGATFKPDLDRLEGLSQVQDMNPAEYREAWAWVHLLLRDKPEARAILLDYLQQLRTNPNPGSLQPKLVKVFPSLEDALEKHLNAVESEQ